MPIVSIIIPVYNVEKFLARCLDSVLAQTFGDFEALCINDGSTDRSLSILEQYAKRDSRIRIITQKNQGLSQARNTGLAHTKGDYVYFLDSDDFIHPQLLETCVYLIQKYQADLVSFGFQKIPGSASVSYPAYRPEDIPCHVTKNPLFRCKKHSRWRIAVNAWSKFYRREVIQNQFFIPGILFEDYPYTYQVLAHHPKTVIIQTPLYFYIQNPASISHTSWTIRHIQSYRTGLLAVEKAYRTAPRKEQHFLHRHVFFNLLKQQDRKIRHTRQPEVKQAFATELWDLKQRGCLRFYWRYPIHYFRWCMLMRSAAIRIVRICGGLGNQMFQYAFGIALGDDVQYDISFYKKSRKVVRTFGLLEWRIPDLTERIIPGLARKLYPQKRQERIENVYEPELLSLTAGYFDGYFQCPQYFEKNRALLLREFTPAAEPNKACQDMLEHIQSVNAISVHVRRGDYVQLQHIIGLCSLDYYKKAIAYMAGHVSKPHFFIFSDDLDWVKQNLKIDFPCTYVDKAWDSDIWDIWLMKHCRHNIIANSSFSWWGAWLNENPKKIVIAPAQWFADGRPTDIVPDDWIKIGSDKTDLKKD